MKQNKCPLKNSVARAGIGVLLLGMMSAVTTAQTPYYFRWAVNPQGNASVVDLAVDASGNAHLTGGYGYDRTALDFGTTILPAPSHGQGEAFFVKYDRAGRVQWAKGVQADAGSRGAGIAVDSSGNLYLTGSFAGTANFDGTFLSGSGADVFLAKYSSAGTLQWVRKGGGIYYDFSAGVALDSAGNSYVAGNINLTATFGSVTLTNDGLFVAKYDTSGNLLWAKQPQTISGKIAGEGIAAQTNGNVFLTGGFRGAVAFASTTLTSTDVESLFIAKYDANGNVMWARQSHGGGSYGSRIAADGVGNCYLTGWFTGAILLGSISLTSIGYHDIFVAKYNAAGQVLWAKQAGSSSHYDHGIGVAVGEGGQIYVTGEFGGMADFDGTTLSAAPNQFGQVYGDVFVASYGPTGGFLWADRAGGVSGSDCGVDIGLDASGSAYVTGSMWSTDAAFGSLTITNTRGGRTFFLTRLDPPPRLSIQRAGAEVVLSWPADAADFTLQFANTLAPTPSWTNSTIAPGIVGDRARVTNQVSGTSRGYRLRHP